MIKRRYVVILVIISVVCGVNLNKAASTIAQAHTTDISIEDGTNEGRKYIEELEKIDPISVEEEINQTKKQAQVEKYLKEDGSVDFIKYFKNTIFVGDSITEFISEANLLPKSNVYAEKGKTVEKAKSEIEKLKYANPERIVLLFGLNDVSLYNDEIEFKNAYLDYVHTIKRTLPNAKIYLESPTLVQPKAENKESGLYNEKLRRFQKSAKEVAEETNIVFVDLNTLVSSKDYYEPDGIHFKYDFYTPLFNYLKNIMDEER